MTTRDIIKNCLICGTPIPGLKICNNCRTAEKMRLELTLQPKFDKSKKFTTLEVLKEAYLNPDKSYIGFGSEPNSEEYISYSEHSGQYLSPTKPRLNLDSILLLERSNYIWYQISEPRKIDLIHPIQIAITNNGWYITKACIENWENYMGEWSVKYDMMENKIYLEEILNDDTRSI